MKLVFFEKYFTVLLLLLAFVLTTNAQPIPSNGKDILNYKSLQSFRFEKGEIGNIVTAKAEKNRDISLTITTSQRVEDVWRLSSRLPVWKPKLAKGTILLLAFEARTLQASLETEEAKVMFLFGIAEKGKNQERKAISIAGQWQKYYIPIELKENVSKGDFFLALQFGFPPQQFEMRNLRLLHYPPGTDINTMPRTRITYGGMEADAPWRTAAAERIEEHRKGDFSLEFVDKKGKALSDIPVQVTLKRHNFGWGAAFNARKMLADPKRVEFFSGAFNLGVFENDVKIKFWNKDGREEQVLEAMDILQKRHVDLKGHVLIWPGFRHLTPVFKQNKDNPEKIKELIHEHLDDILTATAGRFSAWDVVNEAYTNQDLQKITGSEEILCGGFRILHKKEPSVLRFVNEFGIINKGGLNLKKREWYYDYIKRIDEKTGGLVDGIGIQSHIGSDLTPIPKVLEILDYYATLNKKISISEFTLDMDDPVIRKAYTRDFLIAAFSHPQVFEFLFWGFQREKADIFTEDWQSGSMGDAYFDLVHGAWKTNLFLNTDETGLTQERGFFGEYEYSYMVEEDVFTGTFDLLPGEKTEIKVTVD